MGFFSSVYNKVRNFLIGPAKKPKEEVTKGTIEQEVKKQITIEFAKLKQEREDLKKEREEFKKEREEFEKIKQKEKKVSVKETKTLPIRRGLGKVVGVFLKILVLHEDSYQFISWGDTFLTKNLSPQAYDDFYAFITGLIGSHYPHKHGVLASVLVQSWEKSKAKVIIERDFIPTQDGRITELTGDHILTDNGYLITVKDFMNAPSLFYYDEKIDNLEVLTQEEFLILTNLHQRKEVN